MRKICTSESRFKKKTVFNSEQKGEKNTFEIKKNLVLNIIHESNYKYRTTF